jgi:hypothetical protein
MTANNNRLGPTWNQTRHVFNDDGLAEDRTTQDVSNGAVWRAPHFFQAKFFNAAFIRRDRRAFDANTIFLIASAESMVIWSLVSSRFSTLRS